jgi:TonB family protein
MWERNGAPILALRKGTAQAFNSPRARKQSPVSHAGHGSQYPGVRAGGQMRFKLYLGRAAFAISHAVSGELSRKLSREPEADLRTGQSNTIPQNPAKHIERKEIMQHRTSFRNRGLKFLALSVAVHVLLSMLPFLFLSSSLRPRVSTVDSTKVKYYPAMLYLAGGTHARPNHQPAGRKRHVAEKQKKTSDLALKAQPAPPQGQPVATPHEPIAGPGTDTENAETAFPVFSPHPSVKDRSLLPRSQEQVVVDVKVSAGGEVLEATLVKGIGNGLDQIVLDTVKTWRFHPATVNGNPVPTEAELIFPFDGRYPATPS